MPYAIERYGDKAIVVNTKTHEHFSKKPIPMINAEKQISVLNRVEAFKKKYKK
jgi:hypothetical protein